MQKLLHAIKFDPSSRNLIFVCAKFYEVVELKSSAESTSLGQRNSKWCCPVLWRQLVAKVIFEKCQQITNLEGCSFGDLLFLQCLVVFVC